jgi:hypothetical protein
MLGCGRHLRVDAAAGERRPISIFFVKSTGTIELSWTFCEVTPVAEMNLVRRIKVNVRVAPDYQYPVLMNAVMEEAVFLEDEYIDWISESFGKVVMNVEDIELNLIELWPNASRRMPLLLLSESANEQMEPDASSANNAKRPCLVYTIDTLPKKILCRISSFL